MCSTVSAPGKLFLAGEWSALVPGNSALLVASGRRIHASVSHRESSTLLRLNRWGTAIEFSDSPCAMKGVGGWLRTPPYAVPATAMMISHQYVRSHRTYELTVYGDEECTLPIPGSSAAATVAIVAAILNWHGESVSRETLFRLAALSHLLAQRWHGSAADVAASVYGGCISFRSFNSLWVKKELRRSGVRALCQKSWPGVKIERQEWPEEAVLIAGWSGSDSSSIALAEKFSDWRAAQPDNSESLLRMIAHCSESMQCAFQLRCRTLIHQLLIHHQELFAQLTQRSSIPVVTPRLTELCECARTCGAAAKISGAGGGDFVVALAFSRIQAAAIQRAWKGIGVFSTIVEVSRNPGVRPDGQFAVNSPTSSPSTHLEKTCPVALLK